MPLSPIQTAQQAHTITATDITNGFATVPIVWPVPFADTDYTTTIGVHDLDDAISLSFAVGDVHNVTFEGLDAIVYLAAAIPLIQGQLDVHDVTSPSSLSFVAPFSTLYAISAYISGYGDGLHNDHLGLSVTWTDSRPSIGTQTAFVGLIYGDQTQFSGVGTSFFTIPVFVEAGTTVTVFTSVVSGNPFHYDFSARVVQMPNNSTVAQPGERLVVNAVGIHN